MQPEATNGSGGATFVDGNLIYGISEKPLRVVELPAGVIRWKLRQRQTEITRISLKFSDGRCERWDIEWADEPKRHVRPSWPVARNTGLAISRTPEARIP